LPKSVISVLFLKNTLAYYFLSYVTKAQPTGCLLNQQANDELMNFLGRWVGGAGGRGGGVSFSRKELVFFLFFCVLLCFCANLC
jgi:hypothetical protein